MKAPWSYAPALPAAVGISVGAAVAFYTGAGWEVALSALALAAVLFASGKRSLALLIMMTGVGIAAMHMRTPEPAPQRFADRICTVSCTVRKAVPAERTLRMVVDIDSIATGHHSLQPCREFTASASVFDFQREYLPGQRLRMRARLITQPRAGTLIEGQADFSRYAFIDGTVAHMNVRHTDVTDLAYTPTSTQRVANTCRSWMTHHIANSGCNAATTAFLLAVIAGDDLLVDSSTRQRFTTTGLAHILALSGMHVGIIVFMASMLFMGLRALPGGRFIYFAVTTAAVLLYALATGMSPSVARAVVMFAVYALARVLQRRPAPFNALCVSVTVWLLINPRWLFSPGLQLSVAAVASIIWLAPLLNPVDRSRYRLRKAVALFAVPVAALTGTSLISVCYFHTLPVWFLPANVIASLTVPVLICLGALMAVISAVCGVPHVLQAIADWLYGALDATANFFAGTPSAQITGLYPAWWQIMLGALAIVAWVYATVFGRRRALVLTMAGALTAATIVSMAVVKPQAPDGLFIPVTESSTDIIMAQGDRCLLITDGGVQAKNKADQLFAEFLDRRGSRGFELTPYTFNTGLHTRRGNILTCGDKTFYVLTDSILPRQNTHVHYLVAGSRFTGNIVKAAKAAHCDTVLLAASLNLRRQLRYERELTKSGVPVRSLRQKPFALLRNID